MYLKDIPLPEAIARFEEALATARLMGVLGVDEIPVGIEACNRVLAEPIWARISSPHYHAAAMDGFAVRSRDTDGAMPNHPVTMPVGDQVSYVDTGDPLPGWSDAVVPVEVVEALDETGQLSTDPRGPDRIRIRAAVTPWSNVRPMGEDIVATQLVLPAGQVLRPVDLGAIAASGHTTVRVARKPRVLLIPTGSELVPAGSDLKEGEIIEFNSLVLAAQIQNWGGDPVRLKIVPDDFDVIREQMLEAAKTADLILLLAGSSAGSEDFSARVIESLGQVFVHGVAVRPGHPVILGMLAEIKRPGGGIPVIGVPGYPVSAALTGEIFIEPLISRWLGRSPHSPPRIQAKLTRKITSPAGDDDYVRVVVGRVGGRILAAPLARGAGMITSLVRADGICVVPTGSQGLPAGADIEVRLYRPVEEVDRTIFAIGSHDISLDVMAEHLSLRGRKLVSANVGSIGGLVALSRGEAHLAGSHLLDPSSGQFNLPYIHEYLPRIPVKILALVGRQQGLLVPRGNPKEIRAINDLGREDVRFVNRQRGSGTRLLLDYHLNQLNIEPESVQGYDQDEYTHLGVAAAVASGRADSGLGIAAAAQALGLDFIHLFDERYDLIIPTEHFTSDLLKPLLDILQDRKFRDEVGGLPGYDVSRMGEMIAEID